MAVDADDGEAGAPPGQAPPPLRRPGTGFASRLLAIAVGVSTFVHGTRNAHRFGQLTPVYANVPCWNQAAMLEEFVAGAGVIQMGLRVNVTCANPNAYDVEVQPPRAFDRMPPPDVFVGKFPMAVQAGKFVVAPTTLPAGSGGPVQALASVELRGSDAEELLPHFMEDREVPLTLRLEFVVGARVGLGMMEWEGDARFQEDCGLEVRGILPRSYEPKVGGERREAPPVSPMVCGKSWQRISTLMPHIDDRPEDLGSDGVDFMSAKMPGRDSARGEITKIVFLGGDIFLSYLVGAIVSALLWFVGGPWERHHPKQGYQATGEANIARYHEDGGREHTEAFVTPGDPEHHSELGDAS